MKLRKLFLIKQKFKMLTVAILFMVFQLPNAGSAESHMVNDVQLEEAFYQIGQKYRVFFNYDRAIASNIRVEYHDDQHTTLEESLSFVLKNTNLNYKIFDERYVVIYQNDEAGLASLKKMINHFQGIVDEKELIRSRKTELLHPLYELSSLELNRRRVVNNISGVVTDQNGQSLIGVNVLVKGSSQGTATDFDGRFVLTDVNENAILVFSYIGYQSQEVALNGRSNINVTLIEDSQTLDEVVVVGYGTQKKVNVIGSVSQISSEDIESRPIANVSQGLTGQMTGVTVIQRSGKPGSDGGTIRVRGVGSFGASPSALVLIDGVQGSLNDVNPNDIESVSVLKDASSAAIYGARSANGVILITTKNGKSEEFKVKYSGFLGVQSPTELPDFVNSWEYAEMFNIASGSNTYSAEDIANYKSGLDPDNYPNSDFLREVISRNGIRNNQNISMSGGKKGTKYFLSLGYLGQQGIVEENYFDRYNLRLNTESELNSKLTLKTQMYGATSKQNEPIPGPRAGGGLEALLWRALRQNATSLGRASNGDFGIGSAGEGTAISWIASETFLLESNKNAGVNMELVYSPIKNLMLSAKGGYKFDINDGRTFRGSHQLTPTYRINESNLNQRRNTVTYQTVQYIAEYEKSINKNFVTILGGYAFEKQENENFSGSRQDFPSNDYIVISAGGADIQNVYGNDFGWAIQSFFGRLRYNYDEKYLLEATVRHDGSSRFPKTQKYGTFPSAAIGWRISEEEFFNPVSKIVSSLKLKASLGVLGNQNIGNYPYQNTLSTGFNYPFGSGLTTGVARSTFKDPTIHWETTETKDFGFESTFFNHKLEFNATYFNRVTSDILFRPSASVSSILGLGISEVNTGKLKNTGFEFELMHNNSVGDFRYSIQSNLSIINNEVVSLGVGNVDLPNGLVGNGSTLFVGFPMSLYYGYKTDGVFLDQSDIDNWADQSKLNPNPVAGDIRYLDINGPEGVPDGIVDSQYDRTKIGSQIPKYTFSFNLSAKYKGFEIAAFLQGVSGVSGYLDGVPGYAFYGDIANLQRWQMEGRFNPESPTRYPDYPRLEDIRQTGGPNTQLSDWWVLDASYLRLKNIQFGYTFPKSLIQSIGMDNLKIFCSAENILSLNNYRQGWDPEINTNGNYYPILKVFSLGVNASF